MAGVLDASGSWGKYKGYERFVFTGDPILSSMCYRISDRIGNLHGRQWVVTDKDDLKMIKLFSYNHYMPNNLFDWEMIDAIYPFIGGLISARGHFKRRDYKSSFRLTLRNDRAQLLKNIFKFGKNNNQTYNIYNQNECLEFQKTIEENQIPLYGKVAEDYDFWRLYNVQTGE